MKTNSWLTSSLAIYLAGFAVAFAAQPAASTHSKKVKPKEAAAKPAPAPKPAAASSLQNGPAEITQEHVNIRARADVDSEVVAHFGRKDVVEVLEEVVAKKAEPGEPSRWARIAWPKNTPVWVYGDFVDKTSGVVKSAKLNLRGGPGENYSVVGQLNKGDSIKKLEAKGDWLKIEAPATCSAFVAANLVKSKPASETAPVIAATTPAPNAPATALRPATSIPPRPVPHSAPLPPTTTTVVPNDVVVTYPKPAAVPTFTLPPPQPPRPTPSGAPATLAGVSAPPPPVVPVPPAPLPAAPATETKPAVTPPPPALTREPGEIDFRPQREETFVKRVVTREGRVRRSYNIQAPTPLLLENLHNGRVMNYLYSTSTNLNLAAYRGRVVTLTGEEALDERWPNTPVIRVETLQTEP